MDETDIGAERYGKVEVLFRVVREPDREGVCPLSYISPPSSKKAFARSPTTARGPWRDGSMTAYAPAQGH